MNYIKINSQERTLEEADPQWIIRAIQGERDGGTVCVQVRFDIPGIQLCLATPTCGGGGGGKPYARFNTDEQELIDLWRKLGLFDEIDFAPGKVVAFVQQAA